MTKLFTNIIRQTLTFKKWFSLASSPKISKKSSTPLLISCKRKEYNYYYGQLYDKLEEVPLASKGWNNSKAKGDYFTIYPIEDEFEQLLHPFRDMNFNGDILNVLEKEGIVNATEFQYRAIETMRQHEHVLLAAETGCGKTLSYVLPIIQNIIDNNLISESLNSPRAVIVLPNRELAYQIGQVASMLGAPVGIDVKVIVGGKTKKHMMNPTFEKMDVLVGTPGALGKLSTVGIYKFNQIKYLVLDEADTLLDDSFIEKLTSLINRSAGSRIILVSATVPRKFPDVLAPIESSLKHVVSSKIHKPLLNVTQKFLRITSSTKPSHLLQITKNSREPMLVFTNKNATCNWLAQFLRESGLKCSNINGNMNQAIRIEQWNQFVRGETNILSATDVGSRGLNTVQVKHVINYDFPLYAADYLHRVGRVGRLGSSDRCKVTNFITKESEIKFVQQIELAVRRNQPLPNVDGNITRIVQRRIEKNIQEST